MKAIMCLSCMDVRALDPDPLEWVMCRCENVLGRWTDPVKGTMIVSAKDPSKARVLGMHNGMIRASAENGYDAMHNHKWYGSMNKTLCENAHGYVFMQWGSWAALIVPGSTNDSRLTGRAEVVRE
jgi:hypothetical protein